MVDAATRKAVSSIPQLKTNAGENHLHLDEDD